MTQAFRMLSATNGYHPVATNYVIQYARRKDAFKLPHYAQFVQAPAPSFFYYELDRDHAVRVTNGTTATDVWSDGALRPERRDNQPGFREIQSTCTRYNKMISVGNVALEMATKQWRAKQVYLNNLTSQAMTAKTWNVWRGVGTGTGGWVGLDTSSLWPSTNIADVNTLNGGAGTWDEASADPSDSSYMAIRKALLAAATRIFQNTNGVVKWNDLRLVLHPDAARAMSNTSEIRDYYKYAGSYTRDAIEGPSNYNEEYGLPKKLYGIEVVVEDSMAVTDPPTAGATTMSTARTFIKNKTNAVILSRQGGIDAEAGPSFSTFQMWWYGEQMTIETFDDPKHRLTEFHIVEYYAPVAPALVSGFNILNVVGSGV